MLMEHFVRRLPYLLKYVYYILVWDEYCMKPVVYSCCEYKLQEGYERLFRSLIDYSTRKNIVLNLSSILTDFEKAAI